MNRFKSIALIYLGDRLKIYLERHRPFNHYFPLVIRPYQSIILISILDKAINSEFREGTA